MSTQKNLVVLGAGESGVSAARLAHRQGCNVFVSDAGAGAKHLTKELSQDGIEYEVGGHSEERILLADEVVKSPGIPDTVPLIRKLHERQIPVISEIELAWRYAPKTSRIIGITGSNGKTTTTLLVEHLLQSAGLGAKAGGNLGESFARLLLDHEPQEIYVLELSSFQLDGIVEFRPAIAAVLNITPDHLDRYGNDLHRYADSKLRIGMAQLPGDTLLLGPEPKVIAPALRRRNPQSQIIYIRPEEIQGTKLEVNDYTYELATGQLRGQHNAQNALYAIRIAERCGVTPQQIQSGLDTFRPAPHRMETIATSDGRVWINDSKATNVDATYYALESMTSGTVWIAGGTDKGNDYSILYPLLTDRIKTLVCLGKNNEKLLAAFAGRIPEVLECHSAAAAVVFAHHRAGQGESILLSPACASFDLFNNYEDRGDKFRSAVQKLHA